MTQTLSPADIAACARRMPQAFRLPLREQVKRWAIIVLFAAVFAWCLYDFGFSPARIVNGLGRLGHVLSFMFPPHVWTSWGEIEPILQGLGESLAMAFLGTFLGALMAFPLSFLGAKTINRLPLFRFCIRRSFDVVRSVESLILALIFIRAFGLGPLPGVLAIAFSDVGVLAKLFAEAIENTSPKPVDGVVAAGGSRFQAIRFATLPQVLPVLISIWLYTFESNVRSGTILGIVGAGGIGFLLSDRIHAYKWDEAWSIIILIVVMVYVIDGLSAVIRARFIGPVSARR